MTRIRKRASLSSNFPDKLFKAMYSIDYLSRGLKTSSGASRSNVVTKLNSLFPSFKTRAFLSPSNAD